MVVVKRIISLVFLGAMIQSLFGGPLFGQVLDTTYRGARVLAVGEPVDILRDGERWPVSEVGMTLLDGDEIITGAKSRATVLLSLLSEDNEIIVGSSTRVGVVIDELDNTTLNFRIELIYGKLRAKLQSTFGLSTSIRTNAISVTADNDDYVFENREGISTVAVVAGRVLVIPKESSQTIEILERQAVSFGSRGELVQIAGLPDDIFKGLQDEPEEISALRARYNLQSLDPAGASAMTASQQMPLIQQASENAPMGEMAATMQKEPEMTLPPLDEDITQAAPEPAEEANPVPSYDSSENDPGIWSKYKWHIAALSLASVFAYQSMDEAAKYNELADENDDLEAQYKAETSTTLRTELYAEYQVNAEKMSTHQTNMQIYNGLTAITLGFEAYLLYKLFFTDESVAMSNKPFLLLPDQTLPTVNSLANRPRLGFKATWYW